MTILQGLLNTGLHGWVLIEAYIREREHSPTKSIRQRDAGYQMLATCGNTALGTVLGESRINDQLKQ